MRPVTATIATALAVTAALVAVPVMARAPGGGARARDTADPCAALLADVDPDEARVACTREGHEAWAAWIAPPAPGAHDLVLNTAHTRDGGARTTRSERLSEAAVWWPTIAPLELRRDARGATVDVTRVGFRSYALARTTF